MYRLLKEILEGNKGVPLKLRLVNFQQCEITMSGLVQDQPELADYP